MRDQLLKQLRVPVRRTLLKEELQWFRYLKTAVDRQPGVGNPNAEASTPVQEAKLTAEELRQSVDQATSQSSAEGANFANRSEPDSANQSSQTASPGPNDESSSGDSAKENAGFEGQSNHQSSENSESSNSRDEAGGAAPKPSFSVRLKSIFQIVKKEVAEAVLPRQETMSATKARDPSIRPAGNPTATGLSIVKQDESKWRKQWGDMQEKLGLHPFFQRFQGLSDNAAFNKGREVADNIRERWETSDSRFVQRIQDFRDNMASESEPAQALREIRSRYPDFDMVHFVRMLKTDVPVVIKAYLEGNLEALKEHSSREMMERFTGIINAQKAEGLTSDSTILYTSDVELVDIKFVEGDPVVVVQFSCQQINCARDKFGNVVEGSPTDVQRVYYFWALQQEDAGFVGEDGKFHPPRWQLREMMVRGMHNLL